MISLALSAAGWVMKSRAGQWLVGAVIFAAIVTVALARAFSRGEAAQKLAQTKVALEATRERARVDDRIRRIRETEVKDALRKWRGK